MNPFKGLEIKYHRRVFTKTQNIAKHFYRVECCRDLKQAELKHVYLNQKTLINVYDLYAIEHITLRSLIYISFQDQLKLYITQVGTLRFVVFNGCVFTADIQVSNTLNFLDMNHLTKLQCHAKVTTNQYKEYPYTMTCLDPTGDNRGACTVSWYAWDSSGHFGSVKS